MVRKTTKYPNAVKNVEEAEKQSEKVRVHQNMFSALEQPEQPNRVIASIESVECKVDKASSGHEQSSASVKVVNVQKGSLSVNQKKKAKRKMRLAESFNSCRDEKCEAERCKKLIGLLQTRSKERDRMPINACNEQSKKWTKLSIAMDSGAAESVIDPKELPCIPLAETKASQSGEEFSSATSEPIPNLGELKFGMVTREGSLRGMTMQGAPVAMALGSVKRTCAQGHVVVFDDEGSYIYNKSSGEINMLRESCGNYLLDVWVPPPEEVNSLQSGFGRPLP